MKRIIVKSSHKIFIGTFDRLTLNTYNYSPFKSHHFYLMFF